MSWIKLISYQSTIEIPQKYKDWFEMILKQNEREQIVCVLVGQIAFLFSRDKEWVKRVLVPFLKSENKDDFQAAWEGIAYFSRRLYKELADVMIDIYLHGIERINELDGEARAGFIDLYTALMIYVIDNPIVEFIPKLYRVANEKDRKQFINSIENALKNMDMPSKEHLWNSWLKKYWMNRFNNIPVPLEAYEIVAMLDWILELEVLFPEAVEILISGPRISSVTSVFWYRLDKGEMAKKYPDATAKLITFVLNCSADLNYRENKVRKIADSLVCEDDTTSHLLEEALLKSGL